MQLRYVFSELGQGLRRNVTMHIAVVLTLFVSLTMVGMGVLLNTQTQRAEDYWGSKLEITVFLCNERDAQNNPNCTGEVTEAQKADIIKAIEASDEVESYHEESQQEAYDKAKDMMESYYGDNFPDTAKYMEASIWIQLKDAQEFAGVKSAVQNLDGVALVRDQRRVLSPIYTTINVLKWGSLGVATFLVLAALLLVANTIRLAALARRREIGIMRLVGASGLYISLPFLLEALVTAAIGVGLAGGALAAFMKWGIQGQLEDSIRWLPWIGWSEYGVAMGFIAVLGVVLTLLPTLVLTRKYLKV